MKYIITFYPEFFKCAKKEMCQNGKMEFLKRLSETTALYESEKMIEEVSELLSQSIFVRHIMPVYGKMELSGDLAEDMNILLENLREIKSKSSCTAFCVQSRKVNAKAIQYSSKDIEVWIGKRLEEEGMKASFSDYSLKNENLMVVSVLVIGLACYYGKSESRYNLSVHPDEYRVLSRKRRMISRAENKLKEVINRYSINLTGNGSALDVGAAPGGWSKVLADAGYDVVAVDPGDLSQEIKQYSNISHIKNRIENVKLQKEFDVIVNDMNIEPIISARIMCNLSTKLKEKGIAILTIKLPYGDVWKYIYDAKTVLIECFNIMSIKNMTHNRREVTVLLMKKDNQVNL